MSSIIISFLNKAYISRYINNFTSIIMTNKAYVVLQLMIKILLIHAYK